MQRTFRRMTRPHLELLEGTSGWASGLLDAWSRRLEEKSLRRKRTAVARSGGGGGFYGSNKRTKLEVETTHTLTSTRHTRCDEGRRVVMFHRISSVLREKGAEAEAKPSGQTRGTSDGASDTDADDAYILSMYKK